METVMSMDQVIEELEKRKACGEATVKDVPFLREMLKSYTYAMVDLYGALLELDPAIKNHLVMTFGTEERKSFYVILQRAGGHLPHNLDVAYAPKPKEFTCAKCPENQTCAFAWDEYNTNGDCLAEK